MHEASLVRSLIKQIERLCEQHDAHVATEVVVEIGPLSGVETLLVREAFTALRPGTCVENARLTIEEIPLTAVCRECRREFEIVDYRFACRNCGSKQVRIIRGDEFRLLNVTLETDAGQPLRG